MTTITNTITTNYAIPVPSLSNRLIDDLPRLASAITTIDLILAAKLDTTALGSYGAALLNSSYQIKTLNLPAFTGDVFSTGGNATLTLTDSGVAAGTYRSVTVDSKGRVTSGTNPNTLAGYSIIDAVNINKLGATNGVATLDALGRLTTSQIPEYTGDVTTNGSALELVDSGVIEGTYTAVTVDSKGRVVTGFNTSGQAGGVATLDGSSRLTTSQVPGFLGDVTNAPGTLTLALSTTGVAAGTYNTVTVDTKGRVTSGTNVVEPSTGTGDVVRANSPTLVSPALGTPASGVLTNCTGYTFANISTKPTTLTGYGITDAVASSLIGAASGIAPLGSDSKIPSTYLPSYVDDVLEAANFASLPATGETGKIYVAVDTAKIYRWSGSTYIEIATSVSSADTAVKLATARNIAASGDASWAVSFDGSANTTATLTLANVVTAGTGTKVTYNAKGLITGSTTLTVSDITNIATTYQALNANLTTISALSTSTTGFIKLSNGVASFDNATYAVTGGDLGTPSAGVLTNCTGYTYANLTGTTPTWNQNTTGTAAGLSSTLVVGSGGTGVTTLTGIVKGNGTSAFSAAVANVDFVAPSGDLGTPSAGVLTNCSGYVYANLTGTVPTWNQNTTGTAAGLSSTLAVASGGTGATTLTGMIKGNGTSAISAATPGVDFLAPGGTLGTPTNGTLTNCTGYTFANLASKPTTLSGYGITDAIASSLIGAANGIVPLGSDSKISATYLPSYVDDVVEGANLASLPVSGEAGKIYVALDTAKIYRWSGSTYIEIATSVGSSDTAIKLATARSIATTGDASWSVSFDGSTNVSATLTLANVVAAGTGTKVTYNAKGLITGSTTLSVSDITDISTNYQAKHANLTTISGLSTSSTGLIKLTNGVASFDSSSYVVSGGALGAPASGDLTNCTGYTYANLTGTIPTWNQNTTGTAAGLSSTLAVTSGGTGATTLAANNVLLGNGTSAVQTVAPGTTGNVLVSNGTTWVSGSAATASLPTQTGNSGKYLTTDGATASWGSSTGSGNVVLSTSPTLLSPLLGTPTSGVLTNCTGYTYANLTGTVPTWNQNTTGTAAGLSTTLAVSSGGTGVTTSTGSGSVVLSNTPTLLSPLLGTPTSGVLTNCTGYTYANLTGTIPTWNQNTTGTAAGLSTTLAVSSGGTGATSLAANSVLLGNGTSALQTVSPGATGNILISNGTTWTSGAAPISLPSQTGSGGKYLTTDGTNASWSTVLALPTQTGNSGKYLTTDGTNASWSTVASGLLSTPVKNADYTAASYELVRVDTTSNGVTVTFPATPADGSIIGVIDVAKTFGVNAVTVIPGSGKTIEGDSTSMLLNVNGLYASFVYVAASNNWRILQTPLNNNGTGAVRPTSIKIASYTAVEYDLVCTNTTSTAFNVTLPVAPLTGTVVGVMDVAGTYATNNVTVLPGSGATVEGDTSFILDVNNTYASFIYFADTANWRIQNTPAGSVLATGTGSLVNSISPTLIAPLLGTPTSGVLTNCTGYTFANITSKPTTLSGYGITDAVASSLIGAANGVAPLGSDSKISATYLPSYVDDVIEVADYAALPATGEASKIYIALDNNKIYRWTGSVYVEIANSVGSSDTAVKLSTARTISATGDATWSVSFDGSANATAALTLANVVTAGTGTKVTYNAKGLITGSTTLTVSDITNISTTYQGLNANLTSLAGLSTASTGLVKLTNGVASLDTSSYLVSGGALGTPSSGTLTNATGLPISTGVSGLGTGVATFLATPTSANLISVVTDETGSGSLVFGTGPTIDTPKITTELRINNTANTYYVGFKAGAISANKIWTLPTTDGTSNQILKTDGAGNLGWTDATVAAGSNTQIQFNNSGALGASSNLTWDGTALSAPNLVATNSAGGEGGEIRLALAATGTTLSTSVTVDIYQNKLRIFETGGTNRGAYIDLSAATAGVGSNLLSASALTYGTGVTTWFTTPSSANLAAAMTDETGSGSLVFATSPTLVTPNLGIPSSLTLTNATGLPISSGVSGLATGIATFLATPTSANLISAVTDETGTGALVFATSPTLVTPILGTPTSGNFSTGSFTWPTFNQSTTGSAANLTTARNISASGDATWSVSFNGSADATSTLTLANVVTAGTGTKLTYNAKGLITGSSSLTVSDITNISTTYQGLNANLTSVAALSTASTGLVKLTNGTASLDTSSYLISGGALGTPTSGDLSNATNAVAYGIKTATNTVSVSAATAPTVGQALVATSATTATWQTVSGGGGASLPTQTGNTGKYLTTDGTNASWAVVSGGLTSTAVKTSAYTAVSYDLVRANTTSGSFTVTFPTSPADGAQIGVIDIAKTFGSFPLTVTPGAGTTIEGDATGVLLDINGTFAAFVYTASLTNWRIMNIPTTTNAAYNNGTLYPTAVKTSAYSASSNEIVRCNTSGGAFSVTFPAAPLDGAIIGIVDINNTFASNNLTILPAGKTIEGDITSYVLDMSNIYVSFIYTSATNNWSLLETPTASPTASIGKSIAMSIAFGG